MTSSGPETSNIDPYANSLSETKNTWHRPDPSFTHLLSFFLLLTALAWGLAYTPSFGSIFRLSFFFIFFHFIGSSLLISTIAYFAIGRLFGPDGMAASLTGFRGSRGRRRGAAQGLFTQPGEKDQLEFGYCFDVGVPVVSPSRKRLVIDGYIQFRSLAVHSSLCTSIFTSSNFSSYPSSPAAVISSLRSSGTPSISRRSLTTPILLSWGTTHCPSCIIQNYSSFQSSSLRFCGW